MFTVREALDGGWYVVYPGGMDYKGPMTEFEARKLMKMKNLQLHIEKENERRRKMEQEEEDQDEGLSPS